MNPRGLVLLGATGSIGASALDVVGTLGDRWRICGLACHGQWRELAVLAARWRPDAVAIVDPAAAAAARAAGAFDAGVTLLEGRDGLTELAAWDAADTVLNAVVGAAGLPATLAALAAGKRVALANKESLVVGGELVMAAARRASSGPNGTPGAADDPRLVPVDSEHNAIWQLLAGRPRGDVRRVVLTASGGPFRTASREALASVRPDQALAHPTWSMGPKITIDSATLANKGLEIIEAHHLFGLPYDRIEVVIHPQSVVHGLIECTDGTVFAELGPPDMRAPIRAALGWPERVPTASRTDWTALSGLTFEAPDAERFPALALARAAGEAGGTAPAVFNAANEVAVAAFLAGAIAFPAIPAICERVLAAHDVERAHSVAVLLAADQWARERAATA
ncbi:MAG: 1-deoxy-D-xylulose-5-phosphate reductoisomerase, partial [Gemmatimonadota bacterium]